MKWALTAAAAVVAALAIVALIGAMLPKGHTASLSSKFRQPPQDLWEAITGPPTWRPDIRSVQALAPRNGHRTWKEIDKHGGAITYEAMEEIPVARLITRIADPDLPYGGLWIYEITIEPDGCVLRITEDGEIYNPIFRFMARFAIGYTASMQAYLNALHAKFGEPGE